MSNIEHGTNEAAHKYKMERMKEVAEALEAKVTSLEEGENAEHIDQKAVKQMRKDIQALRKAEEKLRKEFEKKFASKKETKEDK
jgi:endonuclease/exonuclease/phosphatase family metal-dependent hydrolase